jgi:hypothetical protein
MDGAFREEAMAGGQYERPLPDVLGLDMMGNVDQNRVWVDRENHAFHDSGVRVGQAEVGG